MNENKTALLKIFSSVLKDRVKSEPRYQNISSEMVKFFSRKELIEIITHNFGGEVPEEAYNLVEMENEELLQLIGDDFSIISYVTNLWSKEALQLPTRQEWVDSKVHSSADTTSESSPKTDTEQKPVSAEEKKLESDPKTENTPNTPPNAKVSESPNPSGQKPEDKKPEEKKQEEKKPEKK
ncbi:MULTISPECIES: hypothetical protein [unclassified Chryseobacterium]|uniref:hypothetical protein n=1 Tax=unclassified Chryseobacterium TaxID=2593645 RepID=UPI000D37402F|nr:MULTISPECIES: hypothetical protein [unclassified Chryseobacterium]MCQ4138788.1 hypothetical protein [Chryseobacterium sp. EO14]PTT70998.1 hypothetical protein DBR25_17470 [Chryseobacterium sp. HMWF001]PVV50739.1 hypothetical protein DD829_21280 [Chryseobacterium sp. HMWF035]